MKRKCEKKLSFPLHFFSQLIISEFDQMMYCLAMAPGGKINAYKPLTRLSVNQGVRMDSGHKV